MSHWKCRAQLESRSLCPAPVGLSCSSEQGESLQVRARSELRRPPPRGWAAHLGKSPNGEPASPPQAFFLLLQRSRGWELLCFFSHTFFSSPPLWSCWLFFWNLKWSTFVYFLASSLRSESWCLASRWLAFWPQLPLQSQPKEPEKLATSTPWEQ